MDLPTSIPKEFYSLFWDVDVEKLDPSQKPFFVIQRMIDRGNTNSVKWVRKSFSDLQITDTFKKIRDFSPRVGNYWQMVLNINPEEMLCLQPHYQLVRKSHWPF